MTTYTFNETEPPVPDTHPEAGSTDRKGKGKMGQTELRSIMHGLITDAIQLVDGELSPERAVATDYYQGKPFGNEEDGRSQTIVTEVRDVVHGTLPSLARIFFGPDRQVEFVARTADGVQIAKQATDYVQYVFAEDNSGFLQTLSLWKDGLIRKIGIVKWWWEKTPPTPACQDDLSEEDALQLLMQPGVTPTSASQNDDGTWQVEYTIENQGGRVCIKALPPEELLYNRTARSFEEALHVTHRTELTTGQLLAMGIDRDVIKAHGGADITLKSNIEATERDDVNRGLIRDPVSGEANEPNEYCESYVKLDVNGDGESELVLVRMIGPMHYPVGDPEPVTHVPFAMWTPYPEPHVLLGQSQADLTMDLQRTKSFIARAMNDSLALAIYPRMAVVEGLVSIEDALNTEIGAIIRTKKEGAVTSFTHEFTGQAALPILGWYDGVSESRTGRDKGSMGLDADALQSSTQQAVGAALTASQEQIEMLARVFAEQLLKPLFRGIYRLLVEHNPKERLVMLRGEYVAVRPDSWNADMDVIVNVGIGTTDKAKKIEALRGIAAAQEQLLQQLGPTNPLVSVPQLRETYARIIELSGFKDVAAFLKPIDPNWQPPQPQPAPPQPTAEQVQAQAQIQVENLRTQKDLKIKQAELTLKQQQQAFEQKLELMKAADDFTLRLYAINAQWGTTTSIAQLEADAQSEAAALSGALDVRKQQHAEAVAANQHALNERAQAHKTALAAADMAHQHAMDQAAAAQAAAQPDASEATQ